ncbi:LysR family transcriptional regulator [Aminobacter sp. Piv2-1]|uniref:LysR family transcriptional regulator n=1 Tax=Aminobacter sp. Piv2-1 TaxID=3031122 RepID=UPI0030A87CA5
MRLTFKMVECFKTVMAVGTVTAAAEVLCTSQPAVSRSINQLETVVGIRLFDRVKGRLVPTAHAHALLADVDKAFRGLDYLERAGASLKSFQNGNISVVCAPAFSHGFIADVAASFLSKHNDVSLTIDTQMSWSISELIDEQKFDLGIAAYEVTSHGATCEPFCAPREVCVMSSDHPMANRSIIDPGDLEGVSSIFLSDRDPYRRRLDRVFEAAGIRRHLVIETPNTSTACAMAARGCGIAVVNPLTALDYIEQGLAMRRFSAGESFHSTLLRAKHRPTSPLIEMFVAELKSARDNGLARAEAYLSA